MYDNANTNYADLLHPVGFNADLNNDYWPKQLAGALQQQTQQLVTDKQVCETLQSETDNIVKRTLSIKSKLEQVFGLLFGSHPEGGTAQQNTAGACIHVDLREAYENLTFIDGRLSTILKLVGGR